MRRVRLTHVIVVALQQGDLEYVAALQIANNLRGEEIRSLVTSIVGCGVEGPNSEVGGAVECTNEHRREWVLGGLDGPFDGVEDGGEDGYDVPDLPVHLPRASATLDTAITRKYPYLLPGDVAEEGAEPVHPRVLPKPLQHQQQACTWGEAGGHGAKALRRKSGLHDQRCCLLVEPLKFLREEASAVVKISNIAEVNLHWDTVSILIFDYRHLVSIPEHRGTCHLSCGGLYPRRGREARI